jgi:hypothetical protein
VPDTLHGDHLQAGQGGEGVHHLVHQLEVSFLPASSHPLDPGTLTTAAIFSAILEICFVFSHVRHVHEAGVRCKIGTPIGCVQLYSQEIVFKGAT